MEEDAHCGAKDADWKKKLGDTIGGKKRGRGGRQAIPALDKRFCSEQE